MIAWLLVMGIFAVVLACSVKASKRPMTDDNDPYFDNPDHPNWRDR